MINSVDLCDTHSVFICINYWKIHSMQTTRKMELVCLGGLPFARLDINELKYVF